MPQSLETQTGPEYAEVSDIANSCVVLRTYSILLTDVLPRVSNELLETERHLLLLAVESKDLSLNLVTCLEEVRSDAESWRP